jgi:hypothetical protein
MLSITLMDIINIESSLGEKILCDNKSYSIICCNNTCSAFNKITKAEISNHREEYYKVLLPKKIEESIENKMFAILKNPNNTCIYKTPNEYEEELKVFISHINEYNYESILEKMINIFKDYVREYYLYDNHTGRYCMFGILMNEYYNLIKYRMKYELKKEDFNEEDDDIYDIIVNYDYKA